MPCYNPLDAHRKIDGSVHIGRSRDDAGGVPLRLPCGRCVGCRQTRARQWAYRCELELAEHDAASFVTLTYQDKHCPPTLVKSHLSGYLKRLREDIAPRRIKFFGAGEYGDKFDRPHYHVLLFGLHHERDRNAIVDAWSVRAKRGRYAAAEPLGFVDVQKCTPKAISYVAGYAAKKLAATRWDRIELVDTETGEVVERQEPFVLMSRGGRHGVGLGGVVRDRHPAAWRSFVVHAGSKAPVPRYLHERWKRDASDDDIQALAEERSSLVTRSREELAVAAVNAEARRSHTEQRRRNKR